MDRPHLLAEFLARMLVVGGTSALARPMTFDVGVRQIVAVAWLHTCVAAVHASVARRSTTALRRLLGELARCRDFLKVISPHS